ncbi:alpha/beta hydrolase [Novosphingobium sp.]|uniref:alpha/beta fold hydrolase n=1 Tax=Novosphingobium sp. TaxID=1874826 RepID=UPI0025F67266|nr:alpha/beta hydrolase [Novosphingobium sp.]MCC6925999.1 alpha/beta hydrolase [Novosphingobium sp.]
MSMAQTRITLASGIELDVVDAGPRDAPALIFLHGFPESHRTWRHQIAHLSGRYRCIAPDQRGYRGSSKPQDVASYTPDKLIGDVFQLADALGVGTFTIVGHDWGGAIAWGTALMGQLNGRVTRAVIANAPHPVGFSRLVWTNRHQRESSQYMRVFRDVANDQLIRDFGLAGMLMKGFEGREMGEDKIEPAEREQLTREWENRDAAFAMINWYRASPLYVPAMDEPYEMPADKAPPVLPPLTIPTLVIWALEDLALPPENLDGLADMVPNMTLVEVPDCGHFVPWEAPGAVNAALDEFLGRTE